MVSKRKTKVNAERKIPNDQSVITVRSFLARCLSITLRKKIFHRRNLFYIFEHNKTKSNKR